MLGSALSAIQLSQLSTLPCCIAVGHIVLLVVLHEFALSFLALLFLFKL
jgi:hypothetical protein